MPNLTIPITSSGLTYETLLPDGTSYKSSSSQFSNTIGEKKRITWTLGTTYADITGTNLYVKVGLFQQGVINNLTPTLPINHQFTFPVGLAAGTYPMAQVLTPGANANLNNNCQVFCEIVSGSSFKIIVEFYQIYDETQYQANSYHDNRSKLLKDFIQATNELTISANNNCYNSTSSQFAITAKFEKPGVIHAPDTYPYTDNATIAIGTGSWNVGFYNRDPQDATPYFSNPIFEFTRGGNPVTNLSGFANTDVLFKVDAPVAVSKVLFWIIRTDTNDNTKTMYDNYEADFEDIINTNANIGASGNKFTTPVINVALDSGSTYKVGCSIERLNLISNAKYRIIAIVYYKSGGTYQSNSFISDELICDDLPNYDGNGFDVQACLSDYNRQFNGNDLECVIEERIKSSVKLQYAFDKWKNDIYARLGLVVTNDIRRYLQNVIVSIYDTNVDILGVVQNIYDYQVATKQSLLGLTYTVPTNMTMEFSDNWSEFTYEWRNRFEANTPCIGTLVNGVPTLPVQGYQYWGGKTLTVKWSFIFIYDDYAVPFQDEVVVYQQIRVKDYSKEMSIKHIDEENSDYDTQSNFCSDLQPCFAGIIPSRFGDKKLIVNILPENGSINTVEEAEVWEGNQLEQMNTPKIINEFENFTLLYSENAGKFCVDLSKLSLNSSYQISALAKKFVDTGYRVTEKQNPSVIEDRITDTNHKRVTK